MKFSESQTKWVGWIATCLSICMYVSYIPQIIDNLNGSPGNPVQPLVAMINCSLWVVYGLFKTPTRDWPLAAANFPGIIFGFLAFFTAISA